MIYLGSAETSLLPEATTQTFPYGSVPISNGRIVQAGFHEWDPTDPTNKYGSLEGDIVVQVLDISGTTPVVATTARYRLRPVDGDYPDVWRLRVLKLDESRVALLWQGTGANQVHIQLVQIGADSAITFGTPSNLGNGFITVQNEDMGYDALLDSSTEDQAAVMGDGRLIYIGVVRRYVYADQTNWKDVLSVCHVRTSGLAVTDLAWWYLNKDEAHDRTAYSNISYEGYVDAHHLDGGRVWHIWGRNTDGHRMAVIDFGAANAQATPTWTNVAFTGSPARHVERTSKKLVIRETNVSTPNYYIVDIADPLGAVHVAPIPDPNTYHVLMAYYPVHLDHSSPTAKDGFWSGLGYGADMKLVEYVVGTDNTVTQKRVVDVPANLKPPNAGTEYGLYVVRNGARTLVTVDFESVNIPYNPLEMSHLYYDQLPGIDMGNNQSRFLQVRAGV